MRAGRVRRRLNFRENEIQIALRDDEFEPNLMQMISLFFAIFELFNQLFKFLVGVCSRFE